MKGQKIRDYLVNEEKIDECKVDEYIDEIMKYNDIFDEFCRWLDERSFDFGEPVDVEGYTAKKIGELAPFMSGIGVYNFLISLREDPDRAKFYILEGFPML